MPENPHLLGRFFRDNQKRQSLDGPDECVWRAVISSEEWPRSPLTSASRTPASRSREAKV